MKVLSHYRHYAFSGLKCVKIFSPKSQKTYSIFCPNHREGGTIILAESLWIPEAAYIISWYPDLIHLPSDWESRQVWFVPGAKRFSRCSRLQYKQSWGLVLGPQQNQCFSKNLSCLGCSVASHNRKITVQGLKILKQD